MVKHRARGRLRRRRGFTIIEVLVAVTVLVVGLLALVGTGALATKMLSRGNRSNRGAFFAQQQLETLRATPCQLLANGSATRAGGFTVSWAITTLTGGTARRARVISQYAAVIGTPRADTVEATILCIR
jgi:prepilin-type N-terminal cleavage/methylation domain-containing protein